MPGWKDRWIGVKMEGRKDSYGRVDRWRDGWRDGWIMVERRKERSTDGKMDRRKGGRID